MINEFSPEQLEQEYKEPELLFLRPELLLHPTLPEPLHGINPRTIMGKTEWDRVRKNVYSFNNYHCFACGVFAPWDEEKEIFSSEQKLHAHECYDFDYRSLTARLVEIVALCPICHDNVHNQRAQAMYDKGVYDIVDMWTIFEHRDNVLGLNAENWGRWSLEYKGKFYYSKFKSKKEWEEYYER